MSENTLSHFISGEWLTTTDGDLTTDLNPSNTSEVIARIPQADQAIIDRAVDAADSARFNWRRMAGPARANLLYEAANALASQRKELGKLVASEVGKPIGEALAEVDRGVAIFRYFGSEAVHPNGEVIPAQTEGSLQYTFRQPVGAVACITPWNFPVAIPLWKICPALAYGNTVVWKPAETASAVASKLMEIFKEAGFPQGVINLVLGRGSVTGDALVSHPGIQAVTFTGSNSTGMRIAQKAAERNIKFQLEMGGKNAAIVLDDADLSQAAKLTAAGAMRYAGQKCTATSRVVVTSRVLDEFVGTLNEAIKALPLAPATDSKSAVGPLISNDSREKVRGYVESGRGSGGTIVLGGNAPETAPLDQGYFFEPTVLVDVPHDAPVVQEEVFGPLLVVQRASGIDEAIQLANATQFGLSVSLFTRDLNAALQYTQDIEAGMVRVNGDTTGVDPHAPFGGMKSSSSHSREQGTAAKEFFTELKTVQINPAG